MAGATLAATIGFGALGVPLSAQNNGVETEADYTPFARFRPLASSATCVIGGNPTEPFVIPPGYRQQVVAVERPGVFTAGGNGTRDLWDMNTHNETGKDAGRYIYRTHEVGANTTGADPTTSPNGSQVTVTDLKTGETKVLAQRADWERFDGIVWTAWGTILAAEETQAASARDPQVPQATAGLVYELFVDRNDPTRLDPSREPITAGDGTTDTVKDGLRARPSLGSKSHEGMRFDRQGNHYGISEVNGGAIYRFVPDRKGDLSIGRLQALKTPNGRTGEGIWVDLDRSAVQVNADVEARAKAANGYERPEDVETDTSTGRDRNNGGNTLYVAVTGAGFGQTGTPGNVFAVDLSNPNKPFIYAYAGPEAGNATFPDFQSPDNLALDRDGNLIIAEDPGGNFPTKNRGDDIWIARAPRGGQGGDDGDDDEGRGRGKRRQPASTVQRFASLTDCDGEPTGVYFSAAESRFRFSNAANGNRPQFQSLDGKPVVITRETLFVNQQHAGPSSVGGGAGPDKLVAITPIDSRNGGDDDDGRGRRDDDDDDDRGGDGQGRGDD